MMTAVKLDMKDMGSIPKKFCGHIKMESRLIILDHRGIYLLSLGKINVAKMENGSNNPKNGLL